MIVRLRHQLQHFVDTMHSTSVTLGAEAETVQRLHDALADGGDLVALIAHLPIADERDRLTVAITQLEESRRLARAHLFDALNKHGISIGEVARIWGISRQLASRIIRDLNLTAADPVESTATD